MGLQAHSELAICLALTHAIGRAQTVEDIYDIALGSLAEGLGIARSAILLFDDAGTMRFVASRGLSQAYQQAVEGHTPWAPDTPDPQPIVIADVETEATLSAYLPVLRAEGIAALAFVPMVSDSRVIGKFMLYFDRPTTLTDADLELAGLIAAQVAFAVVRTRAEEIARRSEEQLRFALDAARMGTWEWDFQTGRVRWSDTLERLHGLPPGGFDGTFEAYEREIHPDDRARVLAAVRRSVDAGVPHEVEYRIVARDGRMRWVEGKGRVEYASGVPVRMSGVCMDVTRRKQAEQARLDAAHEANRLKDEFLAILSHELRTPLSSIIGWVQVLEADPLAADRVPKAVEIIGRNARLQARLIEDILDVSRIITGKLVIEPVPLLPGPMVTTAVAAVAPEARARGIALTHVAPDDLPPIAGDVRRLEQVLGNVLSNAVKFTPDGGRIEVSCTADSAHLTVEVRDSGAGIAADFLPHVFDRFRQGDSRSTRRHGGLGLGLAVARHIVERHGGTIAASSDGEGQGTTVTVRVPLATATAGRAATPDEGGPEVEVRLDGVHVLVVDDQADARHLLRTLIEQRGGHVVDVDGAQAALAALSTACPHVLIADLAMPDVDGFDLIAQLRRTHPHVPGIALTARARPEDRDQALAAGFAMHFAKPFNIHALATSVRDLASGSAAPTA